VPCGEEAACQLAADIASGADDEYALMFASFGAKVVTPSFKS
jgi:hypothetical protein